MRTLRVESTYGTMWYGTVHRWYGMVTYTYYCMYEETYSFVQHEYFGNQSQICLYSTWKLSPFR